jgi:hypothetical protein
MDSQTLLPKAAAAELVAERPGQSIKSNAIILTSGLTGSSVLAGLIARAGFWTGDSTFKKSEYDTHENSELVRLNQQILQEAGYSGNYTMEFSQDAIDLIASLPDQMDETPYREFLKKCNANGPWIWKDPRLWLTIRVWSRFLPLTDCRFVLLTRNIKHAWVSSILRRQIRSFESFKRYELSIQKSLLDFLSAHGISCLALTYENLITKPERAIPELNSHLGTNLTIEDLESTYRGPLYKVPRSSPVDYFKAVMIYLKNYSERADIHEQLSSKNVRGR